MWSDGINGIKGGKKFKTDARQQSFTHAKNVWNDLPDMIKLCRIEHWAIQGN